jgi:PAS domain S-box-containing protein
MPFNNVKIVLRYRTLCLFFFLYCLSVLSLQAQYLLKQWTTENGLPQNSVNALLQDADGYIIIGTNGGLVKFDGIRFTPMAEIEAKLPSKRITALCQARDGMLWVGTEGGGVTGIRGDSTVTFTSKDGLSDDVALSLLEDHKGLLWVGTRSGIHCIDQNRVYAWKLDSTVTNEWIFHIVEDNAGVIWISGASGVYCNQGKQFIRVLKSHADEWHPMMLLADEFGNNWFADSHQMKYVHQSNTTSIPWYRKQCTDGVTFLSCDQDSVYWAGLPQGGLFWFSRSINKQPSDYIALENGKKNFNIHCYFCDREGNRWFGTQGDGLVQIKNRTIDVFSSQLGLSNDILEAVMEDSYGNIWAGTNGGGINKIDPAGHITSFKQMGEKENVFVWSLTEDHDHALWFGSYGEGVCRFMDGKFHWFTVKDGLCQNVVLALYTDHDGVVWIGTNGGLNKYDHGKMTAYRTKDGLVHNNVNVIYEDRSGAMWFGTYGGLSKFQNGTFKNYTKANGLSNNYVRAIYQDAEGALWIGTYGGGLLRLKNGVFKNISDREGLYDNIVSSIVEDSNQNLWMSCNKGIYRVLKSQLNQCADGVLPFVVSVSYGIADGMLSSETNGGFQPAVWMTKNGRLLYPTIKGLAVLPLSRVQPRVSVMPVHIERILINHVEYQPQHQIELPYRDYQIEIEYTAPNFLLPNQTTFQYKLDGFEHAWVDAHTRRTAYYSELPSGSYMFQVLAANSDGVWDSTAAGFQLVINPPYWRTWWFLTLAAVMLLGIVATIRNLMQAFARRREKEQKEYHQRIAASEEKYRTLFEESKDNIFIATAEGQVLDLNQAGMEMFGYTSKDALINIRLDYWPVDYNDHLRLISMVRQHGFVKKYEVSLKTQSGGVFIGLVTAIAVRDKRGNILSIRGTIQDITQIKRAEEELRKKEELYRNLVENISELFFVCDAKGNITYASPSLYTITGFTLQDLVGHSYVDFVMPEDRAGVENHYRACIVQGVLDTKCEFRALYKKGTYGWIEVVTRIIRDDAGNLLEYRNLARDISDRIHARELRDAFSRQQLQAQENERKRIAGELHDSIGQELLIIKNRALLAMDENNSKEEILEQLQEVSQIASQAIDETRQIAYNLRPYQIDRLGIKKALESIVSRMTRAANIALISEVDSIDGLLPKENEIHLYRIIQECVNNVIKHAQATQVSLKVQHLKNVLMISFSDNGKGFAVPIPKGQVPESSGMGLAGMAERVRLLGGTWHIVTSAEHGTRIEIIVKANLFHE